MPHVFLLNPNSSADVTRSIDEALAGVRKGLGVEVTCATLAEGPPGIETQEDVDRVVLPVARRIAAEKADAYVIACFSDPGLYLVRETVRRPVVGIAESAFHLASGVGERFGIVSIRERSIPRHLRHVRALGYESRLAGDRAINLGVAELANRETAVGRIVAVGMQLRDDDGADAIILGCAGMARYRPELENRLGTAVIDPCQAGVARAAALVALGYAPRA